MKYLSNAIILTVMLAAVSFGQTVVQSGGQLEAHSKPRIAVLEFSPEPGVTGVDAEGTKALQAAIVKEMKKDPSDKGWVEIPSTSSALVRDFYQKYLGRSADTAAVVKIGLQLGVTHVMTGTVKTYDHKVGGGTLAVKSEVVEVATGKIVWSGTGEAAGTGLTKAGTGTLALSSSNLIKPTIQKLTASLKAADL